MRGWSQRFGRLDPSARLTRAERRIRTLQSGCPHKWRKVRTPWERRPEPILLFVCVRCTTMLQKHLYLTETPLGPRVQLHRIFVRHGDMQPLEEA